MLNSNSWRFGHQYFVQTGGVSAPILEGGGPLDLGSFGIGPLAAVGGPQAVISVTAETVGGRFDRQA